MEPSPTQTSETPSRPPDYWHHRRRMAYISLLMLVLITLGVFLNAVPDKLQPVLESLIWVYAFLVLGYYGNNALDAFARKGK